MKDDGVWGRIKHGFVVEENQGLHWFSSPLLLAEGVQHGLTSRKGGVSEEPAGLASLNLGWARPDQPENVADNFRRLSQAVDFPIESMTLVRYEHGARAVQVRANDAGTGFPDWSTHVQEYKPKRLFSPCDALVTQSNEVTLITLHADCQPLFFYEKETGIGAMVHAGWKGTAGGIVAETISQMKRMGADASRILAAIGPSISRQNFEVDEPVAEQFRIALRDISAAEDMHWLYGPDENNKYHIDLARVTVAQMVDRGISPEHINVSGLCTFDDQENFFSYRRDGATCGSMAGFLRVPS